MEVWKDRNNKNGLKLIMIGVLEVFEVKKVKLVEGGL